MSDGTELTHVDAAGRLRMVDVGAKPPLRREAVATADFCAAPATLDRLFAGELPKGEAIATARLAGIMAAKRTGELIPLCHPLPLDFAGIEIERAAPDRVRITGTAAIVARTGVEMEALTAVSIAALTLYDMVKAVDRDLRIEGVRLVSKTKTPPA